MSEITQLLERAEKGDAQAVHELLPLVYDELRKVAAYKMSSEASGHTLQPTALVHEAYARLAGGRVAAPRDRTHFFAMAARLMREILVDHARRRAARKRGGSATVIALDDAICALPDVTLVDLIALDQALTELHARDPRLCQVVELKFFAGLNIEETAHALQVSEATVERDWAVARAWLHQRLSPDR